MFQIMIRSFFSMFAISSLIQPMTKASDCSIKVNSTMTMFENKTQGDGANQTIVCDAAVEAFNELKSSSCLSDVQLRLNFLKLQSLLSKRNVTCDLESEAYENDCKAASRKCSNECALNIFTSQGAQSLLTCQYFAEYIVCLQSIKECSSSTNITTLNQTLSQDVKEIQDRACVFPQLSTTLIPEQCDQVMEQCLSPLDLQPVTCPKLKTALTCTLNAKCASEMSAAILHVNTTRKSNLSSCDVSDLFPSDCRKCLKEYVLNQTAVNLTDNALQCSTLDNYLRCQRDTCSADRQKLIDKKTEELKRLNITECETKSLNSNGVKPASICIVTSAMILVVVVMVENFSSSN